MNELRIVPYEERYENELRKLSSGMLDELLFNGDVISKSAVICLFQETVIGAAFLSMCSTFKAMKEPIAYHHLSGTYTVSTEMMRPAISDEEYLSEVGINATELLLNELKKSYEEIQRAFPGKRIVLRLFSDSARTEYIEFLTDLGFTAGRPMLHMEKELTEEDCLYDNHYETGDISVQFKILNLMEPDTAAEYIRVSRASFTIPDSLVDLRYRASRGMKVYGAVTENGHLLSSVCTFEDGDTIATENIISDPEYRKRGITTALLQYIFGQLLDEGQEIVSLSLFSDNVTAFRFYLGLGYELTSVKLAMNYEYDREPRAY